MAADGLRKIRLRLDDGSLVGHAMALKQGEGDGFLRLGVRDCLANELAGDKEYERLQRLLQSTDLPEITGPPPAKKPKLESRPSMSVPDDWNSKCTEMLNATIKALEKDGNNAHWFMERVEASAVPDYYLKVHESKAMWFKLVRQRLERREYDNPNKWYDDMRQIWVNCKTYNPTGNLVRAAAEHAEKRLEDLWNRSGLSTERARRLTAGHAPPKFDPDDLLEVPAAPSRPRPTTSRGQAPSKTGRKGPANGAMPSASQEVVSGGAAVHGGLGSERRQAIANALQNSLGDGTLNEDKISELMALLPAEAMTTDEEGETELDFEALDDATLRTLDEWLRSTLGQAPHASPSHLSLNPSIRIDAGDEEDDEDYASD